MSLSLIMILVNVSTWDTGFGVMFLCSRITREFDQISVASQVLNMEKALINDSRRQF